MGGDDVMLRGGCVRLLRLRRSYAANQQLEDEEGSVELRTCERLISVNRPIRSDSSFFNREACPVVTTGERVRLLDV